MDRSTDEMNLYSYLVEDGANCVVHVTPCLPHKDFHAGQLFGVENARAIPHDHVTDAIEGVGGLICSTKLPVDTEKCDRVDQNSAVKNSLNVRRYFAALGVQAVRPCQRETRCPQFSRWSSFLFEKSFYCNVSFFRSIHS